MGNAFFKASGLNVKYGDIQVLWDVSFEAEKGEIIALVGSNGAGKSTSVKTVAGLIRHTSGSIVFDGNEIPGGNARAAIDAGIILVPEGRQLFPQMTVYENLEMGACSKMAESKKKETIEKVFHWFPKLKERRGQMAGTLSGGEQQMLAVGRALMSHPRILLLDEPSMGLSPLLVKEIFTTIQEVNQEGVTILLVEQNAKMALSIANRAYVLETGDVVMEGEGQAMLRDDNVRKAYLGA